MASEQIQARLSKANFTLSDIDKKAKELEMTRTEFVISAVEMLLGFDINFLKIIQKYSKVFNVPDWKVMQNMIANQLAEEAAENIVHGNKFRTHEEFVVVGLSESGNPVTPGFSDLYDYLKSYYVKELQKNKTPKEIANE